MSSEKEISLIGPFVPAKPNAPEIEPKVIFMSSGEDPFYRGILTFDIRHSTAIMEDLTSADRPILWSKLMRRLRTAMEKLQDSGPFEIYKFLGDGWIVVYDNGPRTLFYMFKVLLDVERTYQKGYQELIKPVLRNTKMPPPEITFGITWGQVTNCTMTGSHELVGKPINEACRLQATASSIMENGDGSRGIISTGMFSKFAEQLDHFVVPYTASLKNVEFGREINCYKLSMSSIQTILERDILSRL